MCESHVLSSTHIIKHVSFVCRYNNNGLSLLDSMSNATYACYGITCVTTVMCGHPCTTPAPKLSQPWLYVPLFSIIIPLFTRVGPAYSDFVRTVHLAALSCWVTSTTRDIVAVKRCSPASLLQSIITSSEVLLFKCVRVCVYVYV